MLYVKVRMIHNTADIGYMQRRIEELGFEVKLFDRELFVFQGLHQSVSDGFRLASILEKNSGLFSYAVDAKKTAQWESQDAKIRKTLEEE